MLVVAQRVSAALFVAVIAFYALRSFFGLHPFFMASLVFLVSEGISTARARNQTKSIREREKHIEWHYYFQLGASVCLVIGFATIYYNKILNGKAHFTTWHGLLGLIVSLSFIGQVMFSLWLHFLSPFSQLLKRAIWKVHELGGYLMFIMVLIVVSFGLVSNWANFALGLYLQIAVFVLLGIVWLIVLFQKVTAKK